MRSLLDDASDIGVASTCWVKVEVATTSTVGDEADADAVLDGAFSKRVSSTCWVKVEVATASTVVGDEADADAVLDGAFSKREASTCWVKEDVATASTVVGDEADADAVLDEAFSRCVGSLSLSRASKRESARSCHPSSIAVAESVPSPFVGGTDSGNHSFAAIEHSVVSSMGSGSSSFSCGCRSSAAMSGPDCGKTAATV